MNDATDSLGEERLPYLESAVAQVPAVHLSHGLT